MKILRTIQMDASDSNVFEKAASPGEIAIPGSFAFADKNYQALSHKEKLTFQCSWLGLASFGHSTFVQVGQASDEELASALQNLANHFVQFYGAPSLKDALPVAQDELNYAASLCEQGAGKTLAIEREEGADGVKERVRIIAPSNPEDHLGLKVWDIVDG